jgi:predicted nucleotidyltransferase
MELNQNIVNELVQSIKPANPYKIILFGSYAAGTANEDSDIDLLIVLDNDEIANTLDKRAERVCLIRQLVKAINQDYSMDIIVYSRREFYNKKYDGNWFIDEIENTGRSIYEKAS